ncbi:MAG: hypothetical protein LBM38_00850 [Clostridiales bacterium]|nr:hypothetical protein [Clostridiales bacterium]
MKKYILLTTFCILFISVGIILADYGLSDITARPGILPTLIAIIKAGT